VKHAASTIGLESSMKPSQRSVYIKSGDFLGVTAYLIEGGRVLGDGRNLWKVAELSFRQRRTESRLFR
jgi:hypothetical protein